MCDNCDCNNYDYGFELMSLQDDVLGLEDGVNELAEPTVRIGFKRMVEEAALPAYSKPGDAGLDVRSAEHVVIQPGATVAVSTGLAPELPPGWELQVRSRSGLAVAGISVLNSPGTIDSGFRGTIRVILHNHTDEVAYVSVGDRIAQLVPNRVPEAIVYEVNELTETARGADGLGSTGVK